MKVVFVASELVPFAKTGGLADVAGALPLALEKIGVDVVAYLPKYKCVTVDRDETVLGKTVSVRFIKHKKYFYRDGLYGTERGDHKDNLQRFTYFCQEVLKDLKARNERVDIIHCHDWQAALIPVYLKTLYRNDPFFKDVKTVFTVHNLGYQGIFPKKLFNQTHLPKALFSIDGLEFYNNINLLKGGLLFSDILTTVSPTYSEEIKMREFGYGLDGVLRVRSDSLFGILNGIDQVSWNPETDETIAAPFNPGDIGKKLINKRDLQRECGLDEKDSAPLIGVISRLADQKGIDLVANALTALMEELGIQFVLLGTGEEKYHKLFQDLAERYRGTGSFNIRFDNALAKKIYAGSDFFLMPSKYEPCGLGQMISLRYGTIPIVRKTGGLADTVTEYNPETGSGNGFVFEAYDPRALVSAVRRALSVFQMPAKMDELRRIAMNEDFSWGRSAGEYKKIYTEVLSAVTV
ncbi:MAG: glycogen synthase GlgA [Candidatus Omnitrophica bacterium]|nr:glycogen synthase GlgA [Candidatus Omnitrophota bacterium]